MSMSFPDAPEAPRQARHWLEDAIAGSEHARLHDELMLLVSELVTNAVRYTADDVGVTVYLHECGVWVSVADDGAGRVEMRHADLTDTSGRGLEILDAMSSSWGVIPERVGKSVWFELADAH